VEFIAIDVETANASFASICQVGLASFDSGELVDEWESLVDPEDFFAYPNMFIHGIHPEDVVGAPTWPALVADLTTRMDGRVAVSHTPFDRVAIQQVCAKYDVPQPDCLWLDSAMVTRRTWSQFASCGYGLQSVCDHIGYEFGAHNALEDAKAAGHVFLAAMCTSGLSAEDWLARVRTPIGGAGAASATKRPGNPNGPLFGEVLIFTGALTMPRREAADLADAIGCEVAESVTQKTTVLVVGDQDVAKLVGHDKSSKHRKAEALIEQGHTIRILCESDFLELVDLASRASGS
jgi:DNA polymerase-3 subunit epsilon